MPTSQREQLAVTLEVVPAAEAAAGELAAMFAAVMHEWQFRPFTCPAATYVYQGQEYACGGVALPTWAEAAAVAEAVREHQCHGAEI